MRRSLIGKRGREGPSPFANVAVHLLDPRLASKHHAVTNVDPVGVIEHFTFAHVAREAGRWAHLLRLNGLQPGDRVLVVAGREWAWRCALLGVLRAGGVAVPCQASMPLDEIRAIGASAAARHLVSIPARPDLAEADGLAVLDAGGVDAIDASRAMREPAHQSLADDVALVLYSTCADGLRGAMHTHASLIAQAEAGRHWLGVGEDEPIWCTAADGSPESIWLLLAGWQEGATIVSVDLELDSEATLELLGRLGTAAVWFSDEEYERLESASPAAWINGSINRALLSDERSSGATAFAKAVGARVAAVFGLAELGVFAGWPAGTEGEDTTVTARPVPGIELAVVGEQGTRLPAGIVGDLAVRGEAPSLVAGYGASADGIRQRDGWFRFGWRGALTADGALQLASRTAAELEPVDAEAEAEERPDREEEAHKLVAAAIAAAAAEAEGARRETAAAEERRRAERQRRGERRRAKQEAERRAEQEAKEREKAEAAALAEREAAVAPRRRAEAAENALAAPEQIDATASTATDSGVVQAKPSKAKPAWQPPGVRPRRGAAAAAGGRTTLHRVTSTARRSAALATAATSRARLRLGRSAAYLIEVVARATAAAGLAGARATRRGAASTVQRTRPVATETTARARTGSGVSAARLEKVTLRGAAAARAGARSTRRWVALTAQRSAALAAATTLGARRQRTELVWYVTIGLLAVGIGVVIAAWLNGG